MAAQVNGLHHVTMIAAGAAANDAFYREALGLRRVKATVNFDSPDVYHLYFGDGAGRAGTVITSFPFGPQVAPGRRGAGEATETAYAVPPGSLSFWEERLGAFGPVRRESRLSEARLATQGPDGEGVALVEVAGDARDPFAAVVPAEHAIRGFHSVTLTLRDAKATARLLDLMGYAEEAREGPVIRMRARAGNGADVVDLVEDPAAPFARQSAGSVHHVAFSVPDRAAQAEVRAALARAGVQATPSIDRDYFWAIYFRTPGGVLFEVATEEPGFARDEAPEALGTALKLPTQHEHLRDRLARAREPLPGLAGVGAEVPA